MKFYKDQDYKEIICDCIEMENFQINDYLEFHFNESSNKNHNWIISLNKNLLPFRKKLELKSKTNGVLKERINSIDFWARNKLSILTKNTNDLANGITIKPETLKMARRELLKDDFYYSPTLDDFKEKELIANEGKSKGEILRYLRVMKEVYQNSRKYYFNYERFEPTKDIMFKLHEEICNYIDLKMLDVNGKAKKGLAIDEGIEVDLSDTKTTEKLIYLKELGVIDYLRESSPFNLSTNALATVLSAITGVNNTTLQSYLNPMITKGLVNKNNPYNSKKSVDKVKAKLIHIGFRLD